LVVSDDRAGTAVAVTQDAVFEITDEGTIGGLWRLLVFGGKNGGMLLLSYLDSGFALAVVADLQSAYREVADCVHFAA
jgi:hypothetical protein